MSRGTKISLVLLSILVFLSLALNGVLLWQWRSFQLQVRQFSRSAHGSVSQAITELEAFQKSTVQFQLNVKKDFPIEATIPFSTTLDVPIAVTIPISQQIDTQVFIVIPQTGLSLPVDVSVPVDVEVPINTQVPVSIDRTIPISTTVPLDVDVPIAIKVDETELVQYLEQLRVGLVKLEQELSRIE